MAKTNSTAYIDFYHTWRYLHEEAQRLNSWQNSKKLVLCSERCQRVADFYVAFANAIIRVREFVRQGRKRYRGPEASGAPNLGRELG